MLSGEGTAAGKYLQVGGVDLEVLIGGEHGVGEGAVVRW